MIPAYLQTIASAVADGDAVDWDGAQTRLSSDRDRAVATQLRELSAISAAHDASARPPRIDRLPRLLVIAAALACLTSVASLAGYVLTWAVDDGGRSGVYSLAILLFGGAATWLGVIGGDDRRALALAGAYWAIAASFSAKGLRGLLLVEAIPSMLRPLLELRPEVFLPAFLWQFARDFPAVVRFGTIDRVSKVALAIATATGIALFIANVAVSFQFDHLIAGASLFARSHQRGQWFWTVVFVTALPALGCIAIRSRAADAAERSKVRWFLWSIVLALAPVTLEVLAESLLPSYARAMCTPTGRIAGALLVYPPLFAFPMLTAYVLLPHDVLDIRVAARRALRYLLTRWFIAWGTAVPVIVLAIVIYVNRSESVVQVLATPRAKFLTWAAVAGSVLIAARGFLSGAVDRWMLQGLTDPGRMLAELGGELRTARTLTELTAMVARAAERTLQTTTAVYLIDEQKEMMGVGASQPPRESLLPVLVQGTGAPCIVEPQGERSYYRLLSHADRRWIREEQIMAMTPIVTDKQSRVRAVMAIKARRSALGLSADDLQFLTAAAGTASLAYASLNLADAAVSPSAEELALQCPVCSRIEPWRPEASRCECGGQWQRAALPDVVGNHLRLDALLGAGGMGIAYRAWDTVLHRPVAVKTLPALTREAADRLLQEARSMAAVSHPHVAVLFGAEQWRGTPVLVVEYLDGGTLDARLRTGPFPLATALSCVQSLADALVYMHGLQRCHGDIKPSNIGFTAEDWPKFLDFGLSRSFKDGTSDPRHIGGTVAYLSPEALNGGEPGSDGDVWALSVVLFEAIAGYHPFLDRRSTVERIKAGSVIQKALPPAVPESVRDLINGLLRPSRLDRPASASALLERVNDIQSNLQSGA